MYKIPISGGPSTGKSTTFKALQSEYPEAFFVEEAAERVIERELQKQKKDPEYEPILPVNNYVKFAPLVIAESIVLENAIPENSELVFLDRSFIDNLGYGAHAGVDTFRPAIERYARAANYTMAFFCDWLGKFERTDIRRETAEEGLEIHRHLETAYHESGLTVVHLPAVSLEERLAIIRNTINELFEREE